MKTLKYGFKDIIINKSLYIAIIIQLIVTYIILGCALTQVKSLYDGISNLDDLANANSYVLVDSTSEAQIDKIYDNDIESKNKLRMIFKEIDKFDDIYVNWKYDCELQNGYLGSVITANKNLMKLFNIEVTKGRNFKEADFNNSENIIPVLIGYDLQRIYNLNEHYIINDGSNDQEVVVVGVIKHNSNIMRMNNFEEMSLNKTIIFPFSVNRLVEMGDIPDYDMALQSLIIISSEKTKVEDFVEKIVETDTFFMGYRKLSESLEKIVNYYRPQIEYEIIISTVILVFAVFSIISNIIIMINNNIREYAIHIYCGARTVDIVKRIMIQMLLIMIIALVPIMVFFSINIVLFIIIIELILLGSISVVVIKALQRKEFNSIIRGL